MSRWFASSMLLCAWCCTAVLTSPAHGEVIKLITPKAVVYPGDLLSESMVMKVRFRVRPRSGATFVREFNQIVNKVARRTLVPGRPIHLSSLREPYVVNRGDTLTMVFSNAGLSIVGTVVAMQPGATGRRIRVRNTDTGVIVSGVVQADGTIRADGGRR